MEWFHELDHDKLVQIGLVAGIILVVIISVKSSWSKNFCKGPGLLVVALTMFGFGVGEWHSGFDQTGLTSLSIGITITFGSIGLLICAIGKWGSEIEKVQKAEKAETAENEGNEE